MSLKSVLIGVATLGAAFGLAGLLLEDRKVEPGFVDRNRVNIIERDRNGIPGKETYLKIGKTAYELRKDEQGKPYLVESDNYRKETVILPH